jgi:hypothetical protein
MKNDWLDNVKDRRAAVLAEGVVRLVQKRLVAAAEALLEEVRLRRPTLLEAVDTMPILVPPDAIGVVPEEELRHRLKEAVAGLPPTPAMSLSEPLRVRSHGIIASIWRPPGGRLKAIAWPQEVLCPDKQ